MADGITLAITCDLDRKRLWRCFAEHSERARWWAPGVALDLEVGGAFSDRYTDDTAVRHETRGEILEVRHAELLVFTWCESAWPKGNSSKVTFRFSGDEGATRVEMRHEPESGFNEELWSDVRADFIGGWLSLLQSLRDHIHRCASGSRHDIVIEKSLHMSTQDAFASWVSESLLCEWLCEQAKVELRQGGVFELGFGADGDRENGTFGCSLISVEQPRGLAAQWRGPSHFPLMREAGSTVIRVSFNDKGKQTLVRLEHFGFGTGAEWNAVRDWQKMAWKKAFEKLE